MECTQVLTKIDWTPPVGSVPNPISEDEEDPEAVEELPARTKFVSQQGPCGAGQASLASRVLFGRVDIQGVQGEDDDDDSVMNGGDYVYQSHESTQPIAVVEEEVRRRRQLSNCLGGTQAAPERMMSMVRDQIDMRDIGAGTRERGAD
ncbi:unnamed protein product [Calypogeia fissa]